MSENRRMVRVFVPHSWVLDLYLFNNGNSPRFIRRMHLPPLPEGYVVLGVHEDFERHGFSFVVTHPTFEEVPDGDIIPQWGPVFPEFEYIELPDQPTVIGD